MHCKNVYQHHHDRQKKLARRILCEHKQSQWNQVDSTDKKTESADRGLCPQRIKTGRGRAE